MEIKFNTPLKTRSWVDGYNSGTTIFLYNFGDAQGCPPWGGCDNEWTQEDVWYISWGTGGKRPFPLIYATGGANAEQWYELSLYGQNVHGAPMKIAGSMTQYVACQQFPEDCPPGTDNYPSDGFAQLYQELNQNPVTAQDLRWMSDMQWYGE